MKIGIHITTYNRLDFTDKCLKSLFWSKAKNYQVVIVDNNSNDGTIEFLKNLKNNEIKKIIFNNENKHLGYAVKQGWNTLKDECDILGWINNDFLFEPGWDQNIRSCFSELKLDYICGITNLTRKQDKKLIGSKMNTPSGNGHFVFDKNVGAAYFLLTKHFINGIYPNTNPWEKGYTGPGSAFSETLHNKNLKGVRLLKPGIVLINPLYTSHKFKEYYDEVFAIRGIEENLTKFRTMENENGICQGITWDDFLNQYYPKKRKKIK
jgi:glycosyltransferase involved in cell wall biosynthesis